MTFSSDVEWQGRHLGPWTAEHLDHWAFPLGGIGAGMVCVEARGSLSHLSLRHQMERFHEPLVYAAVAVKGRPELARLVEGPLPKHRIYGAALGGLGHAGPTAGLPRFAAVEARSKFPYCRLDLSEPGHPLRARLVAWSPFTPPDADRSGMPVAALEYEFLNESDETLEVVFSFNAVNIMAQPASTPVHEIYQGLRRTAHGVSRCDNGFTLWEEGGSERPERTGSCRITASAEKVGVNPRWFRGGWYDTPTITWRDASSGEVIDTSDYDDGGLPSPGGSLFCPMSIAPGKVGRVEVQIAWHAPFSTLRFGADPDPSIPPACGALGDGIEPGLRGGMSEHMMTERKQAPYDTVLDCYRPWYASRFPDVAAVADHFTSNYAQLRADSWRFADSFHDSSLPAPILEAVSANLSILKSPTVLRQFDGRLWAWEGCRDDRGSCFGSCTHVWNYAHAIAHLFPTLERSLRQSEFGEGQNDIGHQMYRISLPVRPAVHDFLAAADGQLGGILKAHRDWRICGDTEWLRDFWPRIRASLDYCISAWDPDGQGRMSEPHHVTYDIEFWGPESLTMSFYVAALTAAVAMGEALGEDVATYRGLTAKATSVLDHELFNGNYYQQTIEWRQARRGSPRDMVRIALGAAYSPEADVLLESEGPKYQYGAGCLADGVIGDWMARACGLGPVMDPDRVSDHLQAVVNHNFRPSLIDHQNPQRAGYAQGEDGGLLLCTWPRGGKPTLPFIYSNEVWTGIEYQVAAHLAMLGREAEAEKIVAALRGRYDGTKRNPFNEYECGHFYSRALASWTLLQAYSGVRYDAVARTLIVDRKVSGSRRVFLSTASGYGVVDLREGQLPRLEVVSGAIPVDRIVLPESELSPT
ncbi:non-lysosomal glucosylceramidase [Phenylobacterium sp. LH3H17]|uniref:GH116 family glycosyl hydrolase n=1 Tax=Phenylobacterium sp. LH3H17 TaxID=2903901 RepID=UPI0020C9A3DF|nr:GH116 family glycosyl hydrolase [Phenylobacterium sp. LH3H17]UTP38304.1 non-lysosomal glucosylceramidase [Phenylobacterium sp. LH3H17]